MDQKLKELLSDVFELKESDLDINLKKEDIDNWDSLSHMILISEIESTFSIKFKLKELNKMHNVGDLINFIISKL